MNSGIYMNVTVIAIYWMFAISQAHIAHYLTQSSQPPNKIGYFFFFFFLHFAILQKMKLRFRKLTKVTILIETLFWLNSSQCSVSQLDDKFGCSHSINTNSIPSELAIAS